MTQVVSQSDKAGHLTPSDANSGKETEVQVRFENSMTAVLTIDVKTEGEDGSKGSPKNEVSSKDMTVQTSSDTASGEIEIKTFEGNDLVDHVSVSSRRGVADLSLSADGAVGVSTEGFFYSDNPEVQMGETLTFTVPSDIGDVQGGTVTFSNLLDNDNKFERALVIASDAEGREVLRCLVSGDESGHVTLDIDVGFSSIDVKPVDNGSWTLSGNSDFQIERIDIKTGKTADEDDVYQHHGGFMSDLFGLFSFKDFSVRDAFERTDRRSIATFFPDTQNYEKAEDKQDEVLHRTLEERELGDRG